MLQAASGAKGFTMADAGIARSHDALHSGTLTRADLSDIVHRKLGLSRNTVRNHGAALYRKLGVHKRTEAVVWGRENGFPVHLSGT